MSRQDCLSQSRLALDTFIFKAYLHAAICRADLSAPRNREANRRV